MRGGIERKHWPMHLRADIVQEGEHANDRQRRHAGGQERSTARRNSLESMSRLIAFAMSGGS